MLSEENPCYRLFLVGLYPPSSSPISDKQLLVSVVDVSIHAQRLAGAPGSKKEDPEIR
jgi:hypothetical protein